MKRFRHFTYLFMLLFVCLAGIAPSTQASAQSDPQEGNPKCVIDQADLLEEDECEQLRTRSDELSAKHNIRLAIVTTPDFQDSGIFGSDFDGYDILDWEITYFTDQELGLGDNSDSGLLLAVSMADRDWGIQSFGSAEETFTQYAREEIGDRIVDYLSDGDYYDAFETYLTLADEFLTAAENGEPYTYDNPYKEYVPIPLIILVAFIVSLIISLIVVNVWKKAMNTRIQQDGAGAYLEKGSFRLTNRSDIFLYHHVTRTKKEQQKSSGGSTHSTSSGTRGKF